MLDIDRNHIPTITSNSTVTYRDEQVRTQFSPPAPLDAEGRVCTELFSRGTPALRGFDFQVNWDSEQFTLDTTRLGDNPLGLTPENLLSVPGVLRVQRDTLLDEISPPMPFGTTLFEMCFLPRTMQSVSYLEIGRRNPSSFQVVFQDTVINNPRSSLLPGSLYLPEQQLTDTVVLEVVPLPGSSQDTVTCATILARQFTGVRAFDFSVAWPEQLRLASVNYPASALAGISLLAQGENSARFGFAPDSLRNISLPPDAPVLEICFAGDFVPCDFYEIVLAAQPATSFFERQIFDFSEGGALPFQLRSGFLYPFAQDSFVLELETAISDPAATEHLVRLSTPTEICLSRFDFSLRFARSELRLRGIETNPDRLPDFDIVQSSSTRPDSVVFQIRNRTGGANVYPAGDIGTLRFRRLGEQDTVALLLGALGASAFVEIRRQDGATFNIPVVFRDGALIFRTDTSSAIPFVTQSAAYPLTLFPNPATGVVHLRGLPTAAPVKVWLYDPLGRLQFQNTLAGDRVELTAVPPGTYFLHVQQGERRWVERLVLR